MSGAAARTLIERKNRNNKYMKNKEIGVTTNNKNHNNNMKQKQKLQIRKERYVALLGNFISVS